MSNAAAQPTDERTTKPRALRPKDAATLIIIDRSKPTPCVLMGKRHAGHKFMPGKFVFPGGRLDPEDRRMVAAGALHEIDEARLASRVLKPSVTRGRALALASIRETFEETGLLIGTKEFGAPDSAPPGVWEQFRVHGVFPALEPLHFVARAITPPDRTKRFDARFFAVDAEAIAARVEGVVGPESELTELVWIPLPETQTLDLPRITTVILADLNSRIAAGFGRHLPTPHYYPSHGKHLRVEL